MPKQRTTAVALSLIALLILVLAVSTIQAEAPPSAPPAPIRLKAETFMPGETMLPVEDDPPLASAEDGGELGFYLIQFTGPVQKGWKRRCRLPEPSYSTIFPNLPTKCG